ncbi:MAG: hypothetical protein WCM76_16740 [Bacteroidota bacterium]
MKGASLKELKAELSTLHQAELFQLCMRLAKYKKENKELLTYLLFESADENAYIGKVKTLISDGFEGINKTNLYLVKKMVRKILRTTNKFIKYSGSGQTEVELLIFFCKQLRAAGVPLQVNTALGNLYLAQIQKIRKTLLTLHEDLQYDYTQEMKPLL